MQRILGCVAAQVNEVHNAVVTQSEFVLVREALATSVTTLSESCHTGSMSERSRKCVNSADADVALELSIKDGESYATEIDGITRDQWEGFLQYARLKTEMNPFIRAAKLAYLDLNRTLRGPNKMAPNATRSFYEIGTEIVSQAIKEIGAIRLQGEQFDDWHRHLCQDLRRDTCPTRFSVGHAQKWVNMGIKYSFAFGEESVPGLVQLWNWAHIPIDNFIIQRVRRLPQAQVAQHALSVALDGLPWSKIDYYDGYFSFQRAIRSIPSGPPLRLEFHWWLEARKARETGAGASCD